MFFQCIIIGHIPECLVWWHSMSYVGYYLTLGHTPIFEFIGCFADFSHYLIYFLIFMGRHTRAYPHPWVHQTFSDLSHYLVYFLIFMGRHTGAYPHPWVHQTFWGTFSLLSLFLDLCESSYWGIPPLALFHWGIPPLFGFVTSRVDFRVVRPICRSLRAISLFRASPCHQFVRASPYFQFV